MPTFEFKQLDVFASQPLKGNPLAVVLGADSLNDRQMAAFARWTNLSETAFLLKPTTAQADYRVRIFTPAQELPFAGHPTLGSAHAWLEAGGAPQSAEIIQECGIGLVRLRRDGSRLAFTAPPLRKDGPLDDITLARVAKCLHIAVGDIQQSAWVDNGPGWLGVMLKDRQTVLDLAPDFHAMGDLRVGVIAPCNRTQDGIDADFEVRAFIPSGGIPEDPVTGSLNAGLAMWLMESHLAGDSYVVSQGTMLGRSGRVHVDKITNDIWIGGTTTTCITGTVSL